MTLHIHALLARHSSRRRRLGRCLLGSALVLGWLASPVHAAATLGESVVKEMYARYRDAWYDTASLTQTTTTYHNDRAPTVETRHEQGMFPGKLRIDVGPPADGHALIMTQGQQYTFEHGTLTGSRPQLSLALVLGFDVYRQAPEITLSQLRRAGIDMSKAHVDVWHGQTVYVVGSANGADIGRQQFWVDADRLLLVRLISDDPWQPGTLVDIRFLNYRSLRHGLIATKVEAYRNHQLVLQEEYADVKIDLPLEPALFDPARLAVSSGG
jgi:hypothetical protein